MKQNGRTVYDSNQTNFTRPSIVGNAVRDNEYNGNQDFRDVFQGQWDALLTPIDGLSLDANLAVSSSNTRHNYLGSTFASFSSVDGGAEVYHLRDFNTNQRYTANYDRTLADVHHFNILLGYEQYKEKYQYFYGLSLIHI